jgi:hypothetical protein
MQRTAKSPGLDGPAAAVQASSMPIASKTLRLRTVLASAAALIVAAGLAVPARAAADDVFTVGNYPVEAKADNAVAAKDRALTDGQRAAFRSLLKRLVPVTAHGRLKDIRVARPGDMLEGIRVRSERNSPTEYIASLDFSFQARAVRNLLQQEGLPFTEEQAPPVVVIPVWRQGAGTPPREEASWTNVWRGLDLEHALTPVKLTPLNPAISAEAVGALASGDGGAIRSLVTSAKSDLVLVALAEPDPATRKLNVTLSGRDSVGAFTLKRSYRIDANDPAYAAELAGVVSLGILEGRWKAIAGQSQGRDAPPPPSARQMPYEPQQPVSAPAMPGPGRQPPSPPIGGGGAAMQVAVEFQGMGEWTDISRKLAAVPGIDGLDVLGLSARGARVTFRYPEGPGQLAQVLASQGLTLRQGGSGWTLSAR